MGVRFKGRIDSYGPPPLEKMDEGFFELNPYEYQHPDS